MARHRHLVRRRRPRLAPGLAGRFRENPATLIDLVTLFTQRTTRQSQLDTLTTPADEAASDPALLDELPCLGDIVTNAPAQ